MITELCPWEELRRRPHIKLAVDVLPDELGGGLYVGLNDGGVLILLDERLDDERAREVLAHEIVHDETRDEDESHSERFRFACDSWLQRIRNSGTPAPAMRSRVHQTQEQMAA